MRLRFDLDGAAGSYKRYILCSTKNDAAFCCIFSSRYCWVPLGSVSVCYMGNPTLSSGGSFCPVWIRWNIGEGKCYPNRSTDLGSRANCPLEVVLATIKSVPLGGVNRPICFTHSLSFHVE